MKPLQNYIKLRSHENLLNVELVDQNDPNFKYCNYEPFSKHSFGFVYNVKALIDILGKPVRPRKNEYEWYFYCEKYDLYFYIKAESSFTSSARTQTASRSFHIYCKNGEEDKVTKILKCLNIKTGMGTIPYN